MANRAVPGLTPEMRAILERDLKAAAERERQAMLDKYVLTAAAVEAGMTMRGIGALLGVSPDTVMRWKDMGEQEKLRRTPAVSPTPGSST